MPPNEQHLTLRWQGVLRYVNGRCWFDDKGTESQCPFPLIRNTQGLRVGESIVDFDGQRVVIAVQFLDEGEG